MKKVILLIFIIPLILGLLVHYTISIYFSQINGNVNFSVAEPICRAIITDNICVSNFEQKPLYFSVCNFDEKGNITAIGMQYNITIKTAQLNAPLKYKLYKINDNGNEENIEINVSKGNVETVSSMIIGTKKETHNYKLEVEYDNNSNIPLDTDISFSIILDSEQVVPR